MDLQKQVTISPTEKRSSSSGIHAGIKLPCQRLHKTGAQSTLLLTGAQILLAHDTAQDESSPAGKRLFCVWQGKLGTRTALPF